MKPCAQFAAVIAERASGPIDAAEEAHLAAHLESCDGCRAEAARLDDLFALLRVAGPSALEEREAASLPRRAAAAAHRPRERRLARRWAVGLAAAAAVVAAVAVPVQLRRSAARQAASDASGLLASAETDTETDALADAAWESTDDSDADVGE